MNQALRLPSSPSRARSASASATRGVERRPEVHRFPDLDALLQLRLLMLHADPGGARRRRDGIEAEHGDGAAVGRRGPLHALHRRRLARAVGADQAEDLAVVHLERHVVHGDGAAVAFDEIADGDDGPGLTHQGGRGYLLGDDDGAAENLAAIRDPS